MKRYNLVTSGVLLLHLNKLNEKVETMETLPPHFCTLISSFNELN